MPLKKQTESDELNQEDASRLFTVIGERHRLHILELLLEGRRHVGELGASLEIEDSLLSKHLRVLRMAGLVEVEREGRRLYYNVPEKLRLAASQKSLRLPCCDIRLKKIGTL